MIVGGWIAGPALAAVKAGSGVDVTVLESERPTSPTASAATCGRPGASRTRSRSAARSAARGRRHRDAARCRSDSRHWSSRRRHSTVRRGAALRGRRAPRDHIDRDRQRRRLPAAGTPSCCECVKFSDDRVKCRQESAKRLKSDPALHDELDESPAGNSNSDLLNEAPSVPATDGASSRLPRVAATIVPRRPPIEPRSEVVELAEHREACRAVRRRRRRRGGFTELGT